MQDEFQVADGQSDVFLGTSMAPRSSTHCPSSIPNVAFQIDVRQGSRGQSVLSLMQQEEPMNIQFTKLILGTAVAIVAVTSGVPGSVAQMRGPLMFQGHQMMSTDEMVTMMDRMRNAKTKEDCDAIRTEHHQAMQKRAAELGITLPQGSQWENMPSGCGAGMMGGDLQKAPTSK